MTPPRSQSYSVPGAATLLAVSTRTVRRLMDEGRLRYYRLHGDTGQRFTTSRWIEEYQEAAANQETCVPQYATRPYKPVLLKF